MQQDLLFDFFKWLLLISHYAVRSLQVRTGNNFSIRHKNIGWEAYSPPSPPPLFSRPWQATLFLFVSTYFSTPVHGTKPCCHSLIRLSASSYWNVLKTLKFRDYFGTKNYLCSLFGMKNSFFEVCRCGF